MRPRPPFNVGDVVVMQPHGYGRDDHIDMSIPWIVEDEPIFHRAWLWGDSGYYTVIYRGPVDELYGKRLIAHVFRKVSKTEMEMRINELQDIYNRMV